MVSRCRLSEWVPSDALLLGGHASVCLLFPIAPTTCAQEEPTLVLNLAAECSEVSLAFTPGGVGVSSARFITSVSGQDELGAAEPVMSMLFSCLRLPMGPKANQFEQSACRGKPARATSSSNQ